MESARLFVRRTARSVRRGYSLTDLLAHLFARVSTTSPCLLDQHGPRRHEISPKIMYRPETKSRMLKLAEGYEALALKAEKRVTEKRTKPDKPK